MSRRGESRCLTLEEVEAFLAGGASDETVRRHLDRCAECSTRRARVERNLRFLDGVTAGRAPGAAQVGTVTGYEILEEIHRGGQGVIYKATHLATRRTVALKVLLAGALATTRQRSRFDREIEIVAGLAHPNVVTVYDSGVTGDGRHFFAMELVGGVPLDDYVRDTPRTVESVLRLFLQILAGVGEAHRRGVIHRDLKPANILIDSDGRPRIVDFGLAKAIGGDGHVQVTVTGEFMGTLAYASPEQVSGAGDHVDVRADVYSLGVILYEMLTGRSPYPVDGRLDEVVKSIAQVEPRSPSSLYRRAHRPDRSSADPAPLRLDRDTETIVLKTLAKRPDDRYQSVAALADDVDRALNGRPIAARRHSRAYVLWKTAARHPGWSAATALALVSLLVVAIGSMVVATQRRAIIAGLQEQAQLREQRLAAADARREALTYYYQAIDLIGRRVRHEEALTLLDRALAADPGFPAAYLERGLLVVPGVIRGIGPRSGDTMEERLASYRDELRAALADFERAHDLAGGDWLVDPATGGTLTPARARSIPDGADGRLADFPDVLRRGDGTLVRVGADGRRTTVGGPGLPRALVSAGNVMMRHLLHHGARTEYDTVLADEMLGCYERAARLDPDDVYTRLSPALAAASDPARQDEAVGRLDELAAGERAAALIELWHAQAEVSLGGPRRLFPEHHAQWDPLRAETAARHAVALAQEDGFSRYLLGVALQTQGRYDDAIEADRRALELVRARPVPDADTLAKLLYNMATCHARLGRFETAWPLYAEAFEQSGRSPIVLLERCNALILAGRSGEARAELDRVMDMLRSESRRRLPNLVLPAAWMLLTSADRDLRDPATALELIEVLRTRPIMSDDPAVVTLEMYALVAAGDADSALALHTEHAHALQGRPMTDVVLSLALAARGNEKGAAELRSRALTAAGESVFTDPYLDRLLQVTAGIRPTRQAAPGSR